MSHLDTERWCSSKQRMQRDVARTFQQGIQVWEARQPESGHQYVPVGCKRVIFNCYVGVVFRVCSATKAGQKQARMLTTVHTDPWYAAHSSSSEFFFVQRKSCIWRSGSEGWVSLLSVGFAQVVRRALDRGEAELTISTHSRTAPVLASIAFVCAVTI